MRKIKNYSISKETLEEMLDSGRFNPCLQITLGDRAGQQTYKLSAGYGDDVEVYREDSAIFILYTNDMLGYVGLEFFVGAEKQGEIFLEEYELNDALGRENLSPLNTIKHLREHII